MKNSCDNEDTIFEGGVLNVTVIDDIFYGVNTIGLVVEDEKADVTRVLFYTPNIRYLSVNDIAYGCRLSIVNPHLRVPMADGYCGLRVDNINSIIPHKELKNSNRCRFCGKENENIIECPRCPRMYCSQVCLNRDKKEMNHGFVCGG